MSQSFARVGIVGAGYIAGVHANAAAPISDVLRIVAVADADASAAQMMAARYGYGNAYGDVAAMLANERLDGVIIATWPSSHLELIHQCVGAGIRYVLCEKPFVLSGADAVDAWQLAERSGSTITEAFMYRHHPAIDRVDRLLASRELGTLDHVRASFTYVNLAAAGAFEPTDPSRPWRLRADQGGGALYDIGAYTINACTYAAAAIPTRVAAFGRQRNAFGTSDKIMGLIDYDNGVVGLIEASETSDCTQELQIFGELGTLHLPFTWTIYDESEITIQRSLPVTHRHPDQHFRTLTDRFAVPRSNAFQDQLMNAANVMRGAASPRVTLAETVVNTLTMEALATSLNEREEVDVRVPPEIARAFLEPSAAVAVPA
jgi:predicted dehydrogenase